MYELSGEGPKWAVCSAGASHEVSLYGDFQVNPKTVYFGFFHLGLCIFVKQQWMC